MPDTETVRLALAVFCGYRNREYKYYRLTDKGKKQLVVEESQRRGTRSAHTVLLTAQVALTIVLLACSGQR